MYSEAPVKRIAYPDVDTVYFGREMMYIPSADRRSPGAWKPSICNVSQWLEPPSEGESTVFQFKFPDLGEGIHEGELLQMARQARRPYAADAPLLDVETDKAAVTIPWPKGGRGIETRRAVGQILKTGETIAVLNTPTRAAAFPQALGRAQAARGPHRPRCRSPFPAPAPVPAPPPPAAMPAAPRREPRRPVRPLRRPGGWPASWGWTSTPCNQQGPAGRVTPEALQRRADSTASRAAPVPFAGGGAPARPARPSQRRRSLRSRRPISPPVPASAIPFLDVEPLPDFSQFGPVEVEPLRSNPATVAHKMVTSKVLVPARRTWTRPT